MDRLHPHAPGGTQDERVRLKAGLVSLVAGALILGAKFAGYAVTGSTAVLSDALESIVNVIAALFALGGLVFAGRPADRNHPYGHGKIEFFSAGFEGGLIVFAAVMIVWESIQALIAGPQVRNIDLGLAIVLGAGAANLLLGRYLLRTGRRTGSLTLVADGRHVLADALTSGGIVVGLLLVRLTGLVWLDPLVAILVALHLLMTGAHLVRYAAGGLLDEEDPVLLGRLVRSLDAQMRDGVIGVHNLRAIRSGRVHHVEAHVVVPEFWSVKQAHDATERVADAVLADLALEGRITFHTDPCRRSWCGGCDVTPCPVRREPFTGRRPLRADEVVLPEPGPED